MKMTEESLLKAMEFGSVRGVMNPMELKDRIKNYVLARTECELATSLGDVNRRYSRKAQQLLGDGVTPLVMMLTTNGGPLTVFNHKGRTWMCGRDILSERIEAVLTGTRNPEDEAGPEEIRERIAGAWADNALAD